jgi:uncharacterized membrane protein YedE/YeeE
MVNWKTTLGGLLTAIGTYLAGLTEPAWLVMVGKGLVVAGPLILGFFAKDSNVTGGDTPNK